MEIRLLPLFAFLSLSLLPGHAALPPEEYWKSVLPNTPMPKAVQDLLHTELRDEKSTSIDVGKGGNNESWRDRNISYAYSKNQLNDNREIDLFFPQKDMQPGATWNLDFTKNLITATLLPRQVAETVPFSSNKLGEILNRFSVKPESLEAEMIKETIKVCEAPAIRGEERYCATSLESMVDFCTSKLGKEVQATSTVVAKETQLQKYTIIPGAKKLAGNKAVVCHKRNYPYAVFYCHSIQAARAYTMPLEGADGTKAKAVAVCHNYVRVWYPQHVLFGMPKFKPGVSVCHFLFEGHIIWTPN